MHTKASNGNKNEEMMISRKIVIPEIVIENAKDYEIEDSEANQIVHESPGFTRNH